jgi:hypothetical protein
MEYPQQVRDYFKKFQEDVVQLKALRAEGCKPEQLVSIAYKLQAPASIFVSHMPRGWLEGHAKIYVTQQADYGLDKSKENKDKILVLAALRNFFDICEQVADSWEVQEAVFGKKE